MTTPRIKNMIGREKKKRAATTTPQINNLIGWMFFIFKYANLWHSCHFRRRGCFGNLLILTAARTFTGYLMSQVIKQNVSPATHGRVYQFDSNNLTDIARHVDSHSNHLHLTVSTPWYDGATV